jgi:hypothetical protein
MVICLYDQNPSHRDHQGNAGVAEFVQSMGRPLDVSQLTPDELAGIERSKAEFREGRTYSLDEARAMSDAMVALPIAGSNKQSATSPHASVTIFEHDKIGPELINSITPVAGCFFDVKAGSTR